MHLEDTYLGSPVQQKFANHFCYILTEKKYSTNNNTLIRTWNSICILASLNFSRAFQVIGMDQF